MLKKATTYLILLLSFFGQKADAENMEAKTALLQASIEVFTTEPKETEAKNVQPGSYVKLKAIVTNVGDLPNNPAQMFIRFAFPKPLSLHSKSILFKTEIKQVPKLAPNESITIDFETAHKWPTIFDFVRNDWAMREYEAIINDGKVEKIFGNRAIFFSAYYYEGLQELFPVKVQAEN